MTIKSKIDYSASDQRMREAKNDPQALVRQRVREHGDYLAAQLPKLEKWITAGVKPEALVRFALLDLSAPTYAGEQLRASTKESIYMGLLACAVAGLEPGALKGEAFLVPFRDNRAGVTRAQYMAGWKGYVKQARRSREVVALASQVVYEHDTFDIDLGSAMPPIHKPFLEGDRGAIRGAYAVAKLVGSRDTIVSYEVEWMSLADLEKVRASARRGDRESDAYKTWWDQMYRKAPIRRAAKRLPMGHDYYLGLAVEQAIEDGKSQRDILDALTDGEASRTEDAAQASREMREQAGDLSDEDKSAIAAEEARGDR